MGLRTTGLLFPCALDLSVLFLSRRDSLPSPPEIFLKSHNVLGLMHRDIFTETDSSWPCPRLPSDLLTTAGYKLGKEEQGDDPFLENPLLLLEPSRCRTRATERLLRNRRGERQKRAAEEASVDSQRLHMADLG